MISSVASETASFVKAGVQQVSAVRSALAQQPHALRPAARQDWEELRDQARDAIAQEEAWVRTTSCRVLSFRGY